MPYLTSIQGFRDEVAREAGATLRRSAVAYTEASFLAECERLERLLPTSPLETASLRDEAIARCAESVLELQGLTLDTCSEDDYLHAVESAIESLR